MTERSIRDEAAHGEQESSRRVTGSSRALIGFKPWLPRIQCGGLVPKNTGRFSACATEVARVGGPQRHDARTTDRAAPGNYNRVKAICA